MLPWSVDYQGRFDEVIIESEALKGNPLGDPFQRPLMVYVPPGYDTDADRRYPAIYEIQGLTNQVDMWNNRSAFRRNFPELLDEMFASGDASPTIVVFVDCWTSIGGSQFLDSAATGKYHTYLSNEIVPWVDEHYRTIASKDHRGIVGHSSGGYGAMVNPMLRPDLWGALGTHAGDALFENCYLPEFRECARALRDEYDGSFENFWKSFRSRVPFSKSSDSVLQNIYAMAACYSADSDGTVQFPFAFTIGQLIPEVWERWLEWDPVRMVSKHADALRSMKGIYVDAGRSDEYFLDLGAEAFRNALVHIGVNDVHFEFFDGKHSASHRYPLSLKFLAERLAPVN